MKIAIWHNLPSGGGKRALYYHARGLVQRGHVVEAWCPPTADETYLPLREFIPEHIVPFHWKPVSEQHRAARVVAPYRNIITKLRAMDHHCRDCAEHITRGGYDVLFGNSCRFFNAASIGRHVRIPRALYLQEPYRALYEALPELPWLALADPPDGRRSIRYLKRFIGNLVEVQGLRVQAREEVVNARAFQVILVNSFFSRESMLRAYGLETEVCYLGIDTNLFVNQRRPRGTFVAGLGKIVPHKRVELIITAIGRVPSPRPDLVWIANAANESHLQNLEQLALQLGVRFRAEVGISDKEVVDILNRAAMLVYAPRLEPFGLAPLEANACGLPVVAVAEGGVRETVIDGVNGLLVEDHPDAIAHAIQRLLHNPTYASQLGDTGSELVSRRWSLSASIDRLEQKLIQVAKSGRSDQSATLEA